DHRGAPSGALVPRFPRASRPGGLPAEPDPDRDPPARRVGALATLADASSPADAGVLPGAAAPAVGGGAPLLRARRGARARYARDTRPAQLLEREARVRWRRRRPQDAALRTAVRRSSPRRRTAAAGSRSR